MKKNYIVDGFNLGFKIPEIAHWIRTGETDRAIQLILNHVNRILSTSSGEIIVVFDGKHGGNRTVPFHTNLTIKFSNKPETADDIIRNFMRSCKNPEDWIVISSDSEIRSTARAMGSRSKKSESVIKLKVKPEPKLRPEMKQKYNPNSIDVNYWLKKFNSGEDE